MVLKKHIAAIMRRQVQLLLQIAVSVIQVGNEAIGGVP
ncbi:hypothetical protein LMG28138_01112 [Pararobbsia alpina]|uniref:Uncharacterized protein n=1 Tax=Pararobbsia alpina TaxID=621374 RepID=A0A6S7B8A9_9BURK|nr:hypothetical protein LMG28138_01112 [Pararobbsia alpina]